MTIQTEFNFPKDSFGYVPGAVPAKMVYSLTEPQSPVEGLWWVKAASTESLVEDIYFYTGSAWIYFGLGAGTVVSETQPQNPRQGMRWLNMSLPAIFVYYVDADSGQWVEEAHEGIDGGLRADLGDADSNVPLAGFQARQLRVINGIKNLVPVANVVMTVKGFYADSALGGGDFYYQADMPWNEHNGGTVIATGALAAWSGAQADLATLLNYSEIGFGCYVRVDEGFVFPDYFGGVNPDITVGFNKACSLGLRVLLRPFECTYQGQLNAKTANVEGVSTQLSTLKYIGASDIVSFVFGSGSVLKNFKLIGPWTEARNVTRSMIGVRDETIGAVNRPYIQNVRVELFGINLNLAGTQNASLDGFFTQYAKYEEYLIENAENSFITKINSNSTRDIALVTDPSVKWLRIKNSRNVRINGGIHERVKAGVIGPVVIEGNSKVTIENTEFNAATDYVVNTKDSAQLTLLNPAFTLSGLGELLVKAEGTSEVLMENPTCSGLGGRHPWSLVSGNVKQLSSEGFLDLFTRSVSKFFNTSGGTGVYENSALKVIGAGAAQGVGFDDLASNNSWIITSADTLGSGLITIGCAALSGVLKVNVYVNRTSAGGFRRKVGEFSNAGVHQFNVTFQDQDTPSTISLGVEWDGSTVDPTYGNKGVATISFKKMTMFK